MILGIHVDHATDRTRTFGASVGLQDLARLIDVQWVNVETRSIVPVETATVVRRARTTHSHKMVARPLYRAGTLCSLLWYMYALQVTQHHLELELHSIGDATCKYGTSWYGRDREGV